MFKAGDLVTRGVYEPDPNGPNMVFQMKTMKIGVVTPIKDEYFPSWIYVKTLLGYTDIVRGWWWSPKWLKPIEPENLSCLSEETLMNLLKESSKK